MRAQSSGSLSAVLFKNTGWYGSHSGFYEQIARRWAGRHPVAKIIVPRSDAWSRMIGKLHSVRLGVRNRNQAESAAELRFLGHLWKEREAAGVVLNMDDHWPMLRWWPKVPRHLVGVIHIPFSRWSRSAKRDCARLSSAIVLWRRDIPRIEALVGHGRVRFVPHGVDAEFFRPGEMPRESDHLLSCGQFLRDFQRLERVFCLLRKERPTLRLTLVVAAHITRHPDLAWTGSTPGVTVLSGISDAALLDCYQRSTALLMPLLDSGANNTVLEALACGLPIITNDVGGIRDYGGGTVFPVSDDSDEALAVLASSLLSDPARLREIGDGQRRLALSLDWDTVCDRLTQVVGDLCRPSHETAKATTGQRSN